MNEWYGDNNLNNWTQKWGITKDFNYNKILKTHKNWCYINNLDYTPALIINNKKFPTFYDMTDIQYFIEYIIKYEQYNLQKSNERNYQLQRDNK